MNELQHLIIGLAFGVFAGMGWGYATGLRALKKDKDNDNGN